MHNMDSLIMVVNPAGAAAENIKELIEFMDEPDVRTATPSRWREQLGDSRLEAVFVGPDLSSKDVHDLVDDIGKLDPNIPIVMISESKDT